MNEANPFQAPQHIEEPKRIAAIDPTRPKPWSVLSILSTLLLLFVVLGSLGLTVVSYRFGLFEEFDSKRGLWQIVYMALILLQLVLLAFWAAVGSGHLALRVLVAGILLAGLCAERIFGGHAPILPTLYIMSISFLAVFTALSLLDFLLFALHAKNDFRSLVLAFMKPVVSTVTVVVILFTTYYFPRLGYYVPVPDWLMFLGGFTAAGFAIAMGGIFLLLHRYGFKRRYYFVGLALFLLTPPSLGLIEAAIEGHWNNALELVFLMGVVELVCLIAFHAAHRMLRSYGGSFVPLPPRKEADRTVAGHIPVVATVGE
ncbi:hypothetical protein [Blastopirellula marina]|uniref:Uncharacterized protein n=1 Tax=Blastopirellula marina TaxID=124 RepID=A0A2S8GPG2_9BACT|nr:hypothetical protein [Blastopirellula marina]PQO46312.1 hypothetical protein C5Y93_10025 [Blastopirellula marina]